MYKVVYRNPRTFKKYDSKHIIGYLNETILDKYQPVTNDSSKIEPYTGYQYEGLEVDGGTIMPCENLNSRDDLINAIIRSKYSESQEFAIQRHHQTDPEAYATEWESYTSFCEAAKIQVDKWL
ncbi:MAG: hypothetical protein LKE54_04380 [Prevotella sp.]|jgi:hypothetical protein|nr:hypothetical protein [Prevotella sp.]MCH3994279.1 hypothetical protein [Prevotella sp.]